MEFIRDLPVEVLSNIVSFTLGEPDCLKIKFNHIETLKKIQNKYKITKTRERKSRMSFLSMIQLYAH